MCSCNIHSSTAHHHAPFFNSKILSNFINYLYRMAEDVSKCELSKTQITMRGVLVTDVETFGNTMVRISTRERFTFQRVKQSRIKEDKRKRATTDLVETRRKRTTNALNCLSLFHLTDECLTFVDKNCNYVLACW